MITIRREQPGDIDAIREVNRRAFVGEQEGHIVDALRKNGAVLASLVATSQGLVVGHILFSPAQVGDIDGAALGPMSVLPDFQRQGIGSRLVDAGARQLQDEGCPFIVVLGHPAFYPRFGFTPARACGLACGWDVPDEVFMVKVLDGARMSGATGLVRYRPEFSTVS